MNVSIEEPSSFIWIIITVSQPSNISFETDIRNTNQLDQQDQKEETRGKRNTQRCEKKVYKKEEIKNQQCELFYSVLHIA
jgi:hypothetical protein